MRRQDSTIHLSVANDVWIVYFLSIYSLFSFKARRGQAVISLALVQLHGVFLFSFVFFPFVELEN